MRSVKIKTKELLEVLKENRKNHIKDFNEAWESYIFDATQQLQKMFESARDEKKIIKDLVGKIEQLNSQKFGLVELLKVHEGHLLTAGEISLFSKTRFRLAKLNLFFQQHGFWLTLQKVLRYFYRVVQS